jgi:hypothetical protein
VVKAASGRRLKDHSDAHAVRGAHAEEHLTLFWKNTDLPTMPADPALVRGVSVRYEINRSPCVNCATYLADFITRDLPSKTAERVSSVVATSSVYQGSMVFTGEIKHRYRKVFDKLIADKLMKGAAVQEFETWKQTQVAKAKDAAKKAKSLERKKIFSGVPRTQKAMAAETARRTAMWDVTPVPNDVRRDWFRMRPMDDHGIAGLAILRSHGITVTALSAQDAGIGDPDGKIGRPMTPEEKAAMSQEELQARRTFLLKLKAKNDEVLKAVDAVRKSLGETGKDDKGDSWVVEHGYVGGP